MIFSFFWNNKGTFKNFQERESNGETSPVQRLEYNIKLQTTRLGDMHAAVKAMTHHVDQTASDSI